METINQSETLQISLNKIVFALFALVQPSGTEPNTAIFGDPKECFSKTRALYPLFTTLFAGRIGNFEIYPIIYSHKDTGREIDEVEACQAYLTKWIMMYLAKDGGTTYSVLEPGFDKASRKNKVNSRQNALSDAKVVAQVLERYKEETNAKIKISQPNKQNRYVTVSLEDESAIATFGDQEIYGLVFKPQAKRNTKKNHGEVFLLARKMKRSRHL